MAIVCVLCVTIIPRTAVGAGTDGARTEPIDVVRAIMATSDGKIDLARAKLTFDKLVDPRVDIAGAPRQIDGMTRTIRQMAGPDAPMRLRLTMLRRYIYEAGPWNGNKPFAYDLSDPLGQKPANRLLTTYLGTRRGTCVSMPVLFVVLAQRLGLNATLSTAPDHMFVKHVDDATGQTFNLETTSGAHVARDIWFRQNMSMTDAAIASGIYMKTLSRKEALVVLADVVLEHAFAEGRFQEAWDLAEMLRPYYRNDLAVLLTPSQAALGLVKEEYLDRYKTKADIPVELLPRLEYLQREVSLALNRAYGLGWRESDGQTQATRPTGASP